MNNHNVTATSVLEIKDSLGLLHFLVSNIIYELIEYVLMNAIETTLECDNMTKSLSLLILINILPCDRGENWPGGVD